MNSCANSASTSVSFTPGFTKRATRAKPCLRDVAGLPDQVDLDRGLHRAQPVHQPGQPVIIVQRIAPLALADEPRVAGLHFDHRPLVLVGVQVDVLALAHQPVEHRGELGQPLDLLDAGELPGLVLGQLVPLPGREQLVRLAQEQDLAQLLVVRVRVEQQDGSPPARTPVR